MASSQSSIFPPIPFSASSPQQNLRLLELTPELVEIIESQRQASSKRRRLWFKSSAPSTSTRIGTNGGETEKEGFLHLCSDEKVWAVKQISTSNSVHVTRMMSVEEMQSLQTDRRDVDGDTTMDGTQERVHEQGPAGDITGPGERGGITAISQVKNILELIEVKSSESDVERQVCDMLPTYQDTDNQADMYLQPHMSAQQLFEDLAFPSKVISSTLKRLFVFGKKWSSAQYEPPALFIPTTNLLLESWTHFTTSCAICEVDLDKAYGLGYAALKGILAEVVTSCTDELEAELAINAILAILRRVAILDDGADFDDVVFHLDISLKGPPFTTAMPGTRAEIVIDQAMTRELVGQWLLASLISTPPPQSGLILDTNGTITVQDVLEGWTLLLPGRSWARECDVHALIASVKGWEVDRDSEGKEVLIPPNKRGGENGRTEQASAPAPKKGKWHEKFGAQRSAAVKQ